MSLLDVWLTPKVRIQIVVRFRRSETGYPIQNLIKSWGLPGRIRALPGNGFDIEVEGRQKNLLTKIEQLEHNPLLAGCSMQTRWLPYSGGYGSFSISF